MTIIKRNKLKKLLITSAEEISVYHMEYITNNNFWHNGKVEKQTKKKKTDKKIHAHKN